jgi:mycothiol synthase
MAAALTAYHLATDGELVTAEQIAVSYENLDPDELARSFVMIEHDIDGPVGYARVGLDSTPEGIVHFLIAPLLPAHSSQALVAAIVDWFVNLARQRAMHDDVSTHICRTWEPHPGPGQSLASTRAGWIVDLGFTVSRFGASMIRPNLDNIPDIALPAGVDVRPATAEMLRAIWDADKLAFIDTFGEETPTEGAFRTFSNDPTHDLSLWKIAWAGDQIVGQIRSYINAEENVAQQRLRGYTEHISTAREWRGKGIASALLAASLAEVRDRGMTQAALGVDTENPADALAIYQRLGFEVVGYDAIFDRAVFDQAVFDQAG